MKPVYYLQTPIKKNNKLLHTPKSLYTDIKKNNKSLHQQSLWLNDTDIKSDDEEHAYKRNPTEHPTFNSDTTTNDEIFSSIKNLENETSIKFTSVLYVQIPAKISTHCSQKTLFRDLSFFQIRDLLSRFLLTK